MKLKRNLLAAAIVAAGAAAAMPAQAIDAGDWLIKIGAHAIDPKSNNGRLAGGALATQVGSDTRPTIMLEYMLTSQLGIELIAAVPFEHDIRLNGADAGSVKHLPPTLSLQYHFNTQGSVMPFVGAGVNYTRFSGERTRGPLAGTRLDLSNSWGLAAHVGVDFRLGDTWFVGVDARWIDIEARVRVDGANVGTVNIDPLAYGAYLGFRF